MDNRRKYPPYAKALLERQRLKTLPWLVVVCVGSDAWNRAKHWNSLPNDCPALVMLPDTRPASLQWPVKGSLVLIDWQQPASEQMIVELVKALLIAGAESITVWPRWVDFKQPAVEYDASRPVGLRWVQTRESIRTYHPPRKEVARAA